MTKILNLDDPATWEQPSPQPDIHALLQQFEPPSQRITHLAAELLGQISPWAKAMEWLRRWQAEREACRRTIEWAAQWLTFWWGLRVLLKGEASESDKVAALRILAKKYFLRGRVFHPARWYKLAPHFARFCHEAEQSPSEAWESLTIAGLVMALEELRPGMAARDVYPLLRRAVRSSIERALCDGQTLDRKGLRTEPLDAEGEGVAALELWGETTLDAVLELVAVAQTMARLTPREQEALLREGGDGATRVARCKAKKKLARIFCLTW